MFRDATQGPRIAAIAVLETAHGNQTKIEQLFAISPAHILYAITKSDVEDYSHRKFEGENKISPFMLALYYDDYHMYPTIVEAVNKAAASRFALSINAAHRYQYIKALHDSFTQNHC